MDKPHRTSEEISRLVYGKETHELEPLSPDEVAGFMGCCIRTLRNWQRRDGFPRAIRRPGGSYYTVAMIRAYLEKKNSMAITQSEKAARQLSALCGTKCGTK